MRRYHISAPDGADASVRGQNNNRSKSGLQCSVQEGETFNIKHMDLVNEEDSWD